MKDDMISRQAAIDYINRALPDWSEDKESAIDCLDNIPAVDAVPVVRCKDCKYSKHWYRDKRICFLWHETGIDVFEDGYCNYAKRQQGDGNQTDIDIKS